MPPRVKKQSTSTKTCKESKDEKRDSLEEEEDVLKFFKEKMRVKLGAGKKSLTTSAEDEQVPEQVPEAPKVPKVPEQVPEEKVDIKIIDFLREKRDNFCNFLLKTSSSEGEKKNIQKLKNIPIDLFYLFIKQRLVPQKNHLDVLISSFVSENKLAIPDGELKEEILARVKLYLQCFIEIADN